MKEKEKKGDFKIPEKALDKIKSQSELDDFYQKENIGQLVSKSGLDLKWTEITSLFSY